MGLNDPLAVDYYAEHWGRMPAPKFATPRDFDAPTLGTRQGKFAKVWLAKPFMPFQQYIADVGGEVELDEETGLWLPRRKLNIVTIQRQAGKSHMAMSRNGERAFSRQNWRAWYTAQTGQDARDQFLKFYDEIVKGAPLEHAVNLKRSNGGETLEFLLNGSTIRPHPPTEEKLHGKQSDGNDIDEAWAFSKEEGEALIQAASPTKLTRPWAQTWIWSAGGTPESTWLAELVARGRDGDPTIGYFEFGIPDDADAEDIDIIAAHHPAFGHTVTRRALADMRTEFGSDAAGWARGAGNRWTEVIGGALDPELWNGSRHPDVIPDDVPVAISAARAADGSQVAIAAAGRIGDLVVAEILAVLPTPYGAAEQIRTIARANRAPVAVPTSGPSKSIYEDLEKLGGVRLVGLSDGDGYAVACANLDDGLKAGKYKFRQHPDLDAAARVVVKRNIGDGAFVWARREAAVPVAPIDAVTAATHVARRLRARRKAKLSTGSA